MKCFAMKKSMKYLEIMFTLLGIFRLDAINIAITIDDHPLASTPVLTCSERTHRILETCNNHNIKVAFFCVGSHCEQFGLEHVESVDREGHFLANHSFNHEHLSGYSLEKFKSEIRKTEDVLRPYPNMRMWFRYPYLDYGYRSVLGGSIEKMNNARDVLKALGYTEGYVTINTFDWHVNKRLVEAKRADKHIDYELLEKVYVSLIKEWCDFFIDLYSELCITHTLLLHANDINGLYLDSILHMINESGWNIVSPEEAFNDVSWRDEHIFSGRNLKLICDVPASLNCNNIDRILDNAKVFT